MSDAAAVYQRELIRLLRAGVPPEEICTVLRADPALAELSDYIATLDHHALTVAAQLVAKWADSDQPMD